MMQFPGRGPAKKQDSGEFAMAGVEPRPALKIIHEPKVYLLGRQVVDEEALEAFLADHNVSHWTTDTEVAAEKLIETAGRLCYMSFAKPRPGGNQPTSTISSKSVTARYSNILSSTCCSRASAAV